MRKTFTEPRVKTAVLLPVDLRRRLQETAEERDTSMNHLLTVAAERYLQQLPPLDTRTSG